MPYVQPDGIPNIFSDLQPELFANILAYVEPDGSSNSQSDGIADIFSDVRPVFLANILANDESDGGSNRHATRCDLSNICRSQRK